MKEGRPPFPPISTPFKELCDNVEPPEDSIDTDDDETEERDREQTEESHLHDAEGMPSLTIYFAIIHISWRCDQMLFSHHLFYFPDDANDKTTRTCARTRRL